MGHVEQTLRFGRVLSIDPRVRRVGHACFEDGKLRDCWLRNFRQGPRSVRVAEDIASYLVKILEDTNPHAILVPETKAIGSRRRSDYGREVIKALTREALARGIAVHVVSAADVRKFARGAGLGPAVNLQDVHRAIVGRFPELQSMLPRPREKLWQSERHYTPLFNAVAMYMAWEARLSETEAC